MEVTALNNQSLFDIATMVYGSAEGAFILALENDLSITDELVQGQILQYNSDNIINKAVVEYYRVNAVKPATALPDNFDPNDEFKIFDPTFDETFE